MSSLLDAEMEKLLEDSIPCRVRAKRGCATHPRSIAERVSVTTLNFLIAFSCFFLNFVGIGRQCTILVTYLCFAFSFA